MVDRPEGMRLVFAEEFDGPELDRSVWLPHYLPAWSSRAATAATYEIRDSVLNLSIPPDQGLWCGDVHQPPLRVSGIQSGNFSGPVGSTVGQSAFRDGLTVSEQQETFWGWTPGPTYIELRARGVVTPRSMAAFWMIGLEDHPDRSGEICVTEMFGNAVEPGASTAVGMGLKAIRDPDLVRRLRGRAPPDRHRRVPHVRGRLDAREGRLPGRRSGDPQLSSAADLSDAGGARGLRLPGLVHRKRRGCRALAPDRLPAWISALNLEVDKPYSRITLRLLWPGSGTCRCPSSSWRRWSWRDSS